MRRSELTRRNSLSGNVYRKALAAEVLPSAAPLTEDEPRDLHGSELTLDSLVILLPTAEL
jgi:hypothetical protein